MLKIYFCAYDKPAIIQNTFKIVIKNSFKIALQIKICFEFIRYLKTVLNVF